MMISGEKVLFLPLAKTKHAVKQQNTTLIDILICQN